MTEEQTVIVIKEPWIVSAKRDVVTVIAVFALMLPGIWMDSSAMQWVGFFLFVVFIFGAAKRHLGDATMTLDEAAAKIEELKRGTP